MLLDQYSTIGDNLKFYQNEEMLALNTDKFVGKPLSSSIIDAKNQIWYGQMANGDWIVGLFNRDSSAQSRSVKFADLGIKGKMKVRDLWRHADEGETDQLNVKLSEFVEDYSAYLLNKRKHVLGEAHYAESMESLEARARRPGLCQSDGQVY